MRTFRNPVISDSEGKDHGDPFVLKHQDQYYLYHTGVNGIHLYQSENLVDWDYRGIVLHPSQSETHWAQIDLWAPEVMYENGVFYMYVAGTHLLPNGKGDDFARRLGIARSSTPEGPFEWDPNPLVDWEWSIDGHPYRDEDGSTWLFYNIRTDASRYKDGTIGCGNVVDKLINLDKLEGQQAKVTYPTERWEGNREGTWYWNEGSFTLRRRGTYYQMYSGGFYADDTYGIGFATARNPRGPWTKYLKNPVFKSAGDILGPGHHCVVLGPDGFTHYVVYHGYIPGEKGRKVHVDRLFWVGDRLEIAGPTSSSQKVPDLPLYDSNIPHWNLSAWVLGTFVGLGPVNVEFDGDGIHHVRAMVNDKSSVVYVDGRLCYRGEGGFGPQLRADTTLSSVLQSALDDDAIYCLGLGESVVWDWGGKDTIELSAAIRGSVILKVDGHNLLEESSEDWTLLRATIKGGGSKMELEATADGASVTDILLAARPPR